MKDSDRSHLNSFSQNGSISNLHSSSILFSDISSSNSTDSTMPVSTLPAVTCTSSLFEEGKPLLAVPPSSISPSQRTLITMSGPHGTDIMTALLSSISELNLPIFDFSFARLHHHVTFTVLVQLPSPIDEDWLVQLQRIAHQWHATLQFDVHDPRLLPPSLNDAPYADRSKYAATVLNQNGLTSAFLKAFSQLLLSNRISVERMHRLNSATYSLEGSPQLRPMSTSITCIEYKLSVPTLTNITAFREALFQLSRSHGSDVSLQEDNVFRRSKRLVVFDMDSTLIKQEVIDELAKHAGVMDQVAQITSAAMHGEFDFTSSLKKRVELLKGTSASTFDLVKQSITFHPGAKDLCRCLKKLGFKLAVLSGGFLPIANHVKQELQLDYAFANQLKISPEGCFTGETIGPIVTGERKAELLEVIAQAEHISLEQVIAVGDGANDLFMLATAGLGIAFNAKPKVQEKAHTRINQSSLLSVLYLLGYTDDDVKTLMAS